MFGYYSDSIVPTMLASSADLAAWMSDIAPANATPLLRSASSLVLEASSGSFYDTDPVTGLATDPLVLQAMNDATCIQAAMWVQINYNPLLGGVLTAGVKASAKLGSGSYTLADAGLAAQAKAAAIAALAPEAFRRLEQMNLTGTRVWTYG